MARTTSVSLLAALALLAGCAAEMPSGECVSSRDCAAGRVCLDGLCRVAPDGGTSCGASCECTSDAVCASSVPPCVEAACVEGSCFFRELDSRCPGSACDFAIGCTGGEADAGGGDDAGSSEDAGGADAGASDAGPRDAGASDGGAADGGARDAGAGDGGGRREIGSACTMDAQCESIMARMGTCLTTFGGEALPGGYCAVACDSLLMRGCDADSLCVRPGGAREGQCLDRCTADSECRRLEGYRCELPSTGGSVRVCLPGRTAIP